MRSSDNELVVYRNEAFTIDKTVVNRDGAPFVVGKLENPHLLITISDSKFVNTFRYKANYFLPLEGNLPTFKWTNIVPLEKVLTAEGVPAYSSFPSGNDVIQGIYEGQNVLFDEDDDAVFSLTRDGVTSYKYRKNGVWVDYNFRFVFTFDTSSTKELVEKTYYYSIQLVSGRKSDDPNRPISTFDYVVPLLSPTKISVLSNLEGRMK